MRIMDGLLILLGKKIANLKVKS
ncbi:hypothetical protein ACHAW6_007921 [Cyclotella cf. meneghiniana]